MAEITLSTVRTNSLATVVAALEEVAAELAGYAADEYNLNNATNDFSDYRWHTAYNSVVDALIAIDYEGIH